MPAQITVPSFAAGGSDIAVGKEWQQGAASSTLIESVTWKSIGPKLSALPLMAKAGGPPSTNQLAAAGQGLSPKPRARPSAAVQLARTPYRTRGLVLDFTIIYGNGTDFTFQTYVPGTGPTYLIDGYPTFGSASFSGTVTFQPGCVIKYVVSPFLRLCGFVVCNGTQASPSILTSAYDYQYGDPYACSPHPAPAVGDVGTGVWLDFALQGNVTLNGLAIRYATTAIECDESCGPGLTTTVANCALYSCNTGIYTSGMNVTIQNSAISQVATPLNWAGGCLYTFAGWFSQGSPPPSASPPTCATVLLGSSVTVSESVTPATVVDWYLSTPSVSQPALVGTGTNFTLSGTQLLTQYGVYDVFVGMSNPFGSNYFQTTYINVADQCGIDALNHFLANTNGKTSSLWTNIPATDPPTGMGWKSNSLVHGMTGFTAISQMNNWDLYPCSCPGQVPVTALTSRHGYTRGHGMGFDGVLGGGEIDRRGTRVPVWFCTANNQLVEADVQLQYTRCYTTNGITYDWTVFIFDRDLVPLGITPMQVGSPLPCSTVVFITTQYKSGTVPGSLAAIGNSFDCVVTPFNYFQASLPLGGDSGSPMMLPAADNFLVLLAGVTTGGPCDLMQQDMNMLTQQLTLNTNNYQMVWHSTHY